MAKIPPANDPFVCWKLTLKKEALVFCKLRVPFAPVDRPWKTELTTFSVCPASNNEVSGVFASSLKVTPAPTARLLVHLS